ncbi:NAD-glutamate dehydrogenase [Nocardia aurantia]|uniref:NAD-specific glutamate dehydrogenase n=1 Tax=Nocardia aurantia TaxID=2585199 RepID=A0A7K0DR89_9NOCA|nr:NAD-glutamate dehydrogenase [Nocardia aurantia]MQY28251.1 NAD-specific glutamate dehydrogenase [Nocardia aurantia]
MAAGTGHSTTGTVFRDDPTDLEAAYFRGIRPGAAPAITARAAEIFAAHRDLAQSREPGTAAVRVYAPGDGTGLDAAVQIINDDMPLLVDAVTATLRRRGLTVADVVHPVFDVVRAARGRLRAVVLGDEQRGAAPNRSTGARSVRESWMHVQLGGWPAGTVAAELERELSGVLDAVRRVADDTSAMLAAVGSVADRLDTAGGAGTFDTAGGAGTFDTAGTVVGAELPESARLLRWLADGHFTVLGYGYYCRPVGATDDAGTWQVPGTGLGVLRDAAADVAIPALGAQRPVLRMTAAGESGLPVSAELYAIGVADLETISATSDSGEPGRVRGQHVFIGSLTVTGQHEDILDIPVISRRVRQVIEHAGYELDSFSGQAMLELLQTFPRSELFAADARRLSDTVTAVMNLGRSRGIRLFLRRDARTGAVYCLVYLPRDRYSTETRRRMQDILLAEFAGEQVTYSARVTDSDLAALLFTVHRLPGAGPVDVSEARRDRLQGELFGAITTWVDRFADRSRRTASGALSASVMRQYADGFPLGYQQEHEPARGLADAVRLHRLAAGGIDTELHHLPGDPADRWRFTLYVAGAEVSLSRVLPVLHSLGVEVLDERPYRIGHPDGVPRWIYDFGLRLSSAPSDGAEDEVRQLVSAAFQAMWFGHSEIDGLNELVLRAGLAWHRIAILRAYVKYLRQAGFTYAGATVTRVLLAHAAVTRSFADLFAARFDPDADPERAAESAAALSEQVSAEIDAVVGLDADRILRAVHGLIAATLRTNYFRRDAAGNRPEYLSFKFDPRQIAELPRPRPQFEIFVYSPRVEGVHLRFGAVARGGLRWSDRLEDFRTEILGLVKAQAVKNAVIVPVGAKGGFVVKQPPAATGDAAADRQALQAEGIACYRTFISGLLDLTDNIDRATGQTVPPARVVRRDGDDTYLVVAADKGTATFSDIANDVAGQYGFWLGDAFASGGSIGYDHKAMGITARGAWESVKRHFAELGVDTQTQDFTVVGVGDMSGDVFGNGMLLSEHIRLVAAFDHRHIFVDPDPVAASSFRERQRLFALPRSSWADYDPALISAGGGVWPRTAKSIPVSPEVRAALDLPVGTTELSPPELIRAILLAPADLFWNGGIGTYIKADAETNAEVGDKSNDAVRVNADRLRVRVIGEGGNLGVTPLGRIEFCAHGGKCNTDAIDNSAGVDCSDHEVNIKILLDGAVAAGELPAAERTGLLASMTDEVAGLVLRDNISQNHRLGLSRAGAVEQAPVYRRVLTELEQRHGLDRRLEALPADAELERRVAAGIGLTSPELSTILAHVKLALKADLLTGDLLDGAAFAGVPAAYFPAPLRDRFAAGIDRHPLRRQIAATSVINDLVDHGGITFAFRLAEDTGADTADVVRAYTAAVEIHDLRDLWSRIRTTAMPEPARYTLAAETIRTLDRTARWLLANRPQPIAVAADIARYRDGVRTLAGRVPAERGDAQRRRADWIRRGAPEALAGEVAGLLYRTVLLDVLDLAEIADRDAAEVADLYFALDAHFEIQRLIDAADAVEHGDRWHTLAGLAVRDDLYGSLRSLTLDVLSATDSGESAAEKITYWESISRSRLARSRAALAQIFALDHYDLATLSVAARQVRGMVGGAEVAVV